MKIESVDFHYLSMPVIHDIGDGSQDALLVSVRTDNGLVGWGECEASPLVTIAAWCCPMSHSACKPVSASVLGQKLETVADIRRIHDLVRANSLDLLQADHALSGIDIALWDLLGKALDAPVFRLLGSERAYPKTAYASQLFGDDAAATFAKARRVADAGFKAAKFGWGPYGRGTVARDADLVHAAREGLGADANLLVDAGTVFGDDVEAAALRLPALQSARALWLEEPFVSGALDAYARLAAMSGAVKMAGGEGCHHAHQAISMIQHAGLGFVQIDTGRIGGITSAKQVADHARVHGTRFVNHTFTTHLALCASLQPYAGSAEDSLCEYPCEPSLLADSFTTSKLLPDADGFIRLPEQPGLGIEPDLAALEKYRVDVEIRVAGKTIYPNFKPIP
ncbi:MAG: mandelate racemase/muconate lactonizing enzyme family protein [Luteolibacter sp.]|jgi:L-alanine-DL-glutamate epimerase-like enolase superfamily enzyme|nr:mandelate racemase/muconate lactonizing enzyme family protein [Luteolibacter sp.]